MLKNKLWLLVGVVAAMVIMAACSAPTPATTEAPTQAATEVATAAPTERSATTGEVPSRKRWSR